MTYLATSETNDDGDGGAGRARIRPRGPRTWTTVECPIEVPAAVREPPPARRRRRPHRRPPRLPPRLRHLLGHQPAVRGGAFGGSEPPEDGYNYDKDLLPPDEERAAAARVTAAVDDLLAAVAETGATLVAVTNEVGLGVVPEYPLARLYRDQLGWANQRLARAADGSTSSSPATRSTSRRSPPRRSPAIDPRHPEGAPVTDLLARTIAAIGPLDADAMRAAEARQMQLTKPPKALGRLETLSIQLAGIQGKDPAGHRATRRSP